MAWTTEEVSGHACEVFRPAKRGQHGFVLLYLHGVHQGRLSEQPVFTQLFDQHGLVVVGPRTARSWWLDVVCPEFDPVLTPEAYLLDHVMPYIDKTFDVQAPKIGLLGTSMGGQGALRLSYRYPDRFPVVAALAPAIDFYKRMFEPEDDDPLLDMFEDPESARQHSAILHIHPLNWPRHQFFCCDPADHKWFDSSDRLQMKLSSLGVPCEYDLETTAGGHGFQYYNHIAPKAIDFLVNRLASEGLRIV